MLCPSSVLRHLDIFGREHLIAADLKDQGASPASELAIGFGSALFLIRLFLGVSFLLGIGLFFGILFRLLFGRNAGHGLFLFRDRLQVLAIRPAPCSFVLNMVPAGLLLSVAGDRRSVWHRCQNSSVRTASDTQSAFGCDFVCCHLQSSYPLICLMISPTVMLPELVARVIDGAWIVRQPLPYCRKASPIACARSFR